MLAAVPIKPFGVAKRRLHGVLDAAARSRVGMAVAANTLAVLGNCDIDVAVVTADDGVATWARQLGFAVITDPDAGLNAAAAAAVAAAGSRSWAIVHADLPLITAADMSAVFDAVPSRGLVLAPAADGGSNVIAGSSAGFDFAYGPGSFHRHLARAARGPHAVVARPGLALDLDTPNDYAVALELLGAPWLAAAAAG
jgi:2-phospho-L-lactate guanylyltransferase